MKKSIINDWGFVCPVCGSHELVKVFLLRERRVPIKSLVYHNDGILLVEVSSPEEAKEADSKNKEAIRYECQTCGLVPKKGKYEEGYKVGVQTEPIISVNDLFQEDYIVRKDDKKRWK